MWSCKFGILKCLTSSVWVPVTTQCILQNAKWENLKQLNADLHESWKCTVPIKCIFDILASREIYFLCSFTSLLHFHLRFNYLPHPHLRMCRLPFTVCQALHVGGTNLFIQKKMWTSHFNCIVCAVDKAKKMLTIFQEYQCPRNENFCLAYWYTSLTETWNCMTDARKTLTFSLWNHELLKLKGTL